MYAYVYYMKCALTIYVLKPLTTKTFTNYFPFLITLTIINHNFRTLSTTLKYIMK